MICEFAFSGTRPAVPTTLPMMKTRAKQAAVLMYMSASRPTLFMKRSSGTLHTCHAHCTGFQLRGSSRVSPALYVSRGEYTR